MQRMNGEEQNDLDYVESRQITVRPIKNQCNGPKLASQLTMKQQQHTMKVQKAGRGSTTTTWQSLHMNGSQNTSHHAHHCRRQHLKAFTTFSSRHQQYLASTISYWTSDALDIKHHELLLITHHAYVHHPYSTIPITYYFGGETFWRISLWKISLETFTLWFAIYFINA